MNNEELKDSVMRHEHALDTIVTRASSMDKELTEAFGRQKEDMAAVKEAQNGAGCTALRLANKEVEIVASGLGATKMSVKKNAADTKTCLEQVDKCITVGGVKWWLLAAVSYTVAFGTYVVQDLHELDKLVTSQKEINKAQTSTNIRFTGKFKASDKIHKELGIDWPRRTK